MKYCDPISDDVEALASRKAFGELTQDERLAVLRVLGSADAYTSMRSMVLKVRAEFTVDIPRLEPRSSSRDSLRRMVEGRAQQQRSIPLVDRCKAAISRRIPVPYSIAAVVAAIAVTLLLHSPSEQSTPAQKIVYVERPVAVPQPVAHQASEQQVQPGTDSILHKTLHHVRKSVEARSVSAVIRDTAREAVAAVVRNVSATLPGSLHNEFVGLGNLRHLRVQPKGRTLAEDSSLSRFARPFSDDTL